MRLHLILIKGCEYMSKKKVCQKSALAGWSYILLMPKGYFTNFAQCLLLEVLFKLEKLFLAFQKICQTCGKSINSKLLFNNYLKIFIHQKNYLKIFDICVEKLTLM